MLSSHDRVSAAKPASAEMQNLDYQGREVRERDGWNRVEKERRSQDEMIARVETRRTRTEKNSEKTERVRGN